MALAAEVEEKKEKYGGLQKALAEMETLVDATKAYLSPEELRLVASKFQDLAARCSGGPVKKEKKEEHADIGEVMWEMAEMPFSQPRLKVTVRFGREGFALLKKEKDGTETVKFWSKWTDVKALFAAPSAETQAIETQKIASTFVICVEPSASETQPFKRCVACANVGAFGKSEEVDLPPELGERQLKRTALMMAFSHFSGRDCVSLCRGSKDSHFTSTVTGSPFARASLGTSQGHLALTPLGFFFQKPPLFLPASQVGSVSCGRAGGASHSSASFFDLVVDMEPLSEEDDEHQGKAVVFEFHNIAKDEMPALQQYLAEVVAPAREKKQDTNGENHEDDDDEDDDSEEDDDDFDPDARDDDDDDDGEEEEEEEDRDNDDDASDDDDGSESSPKDDGQPALKKRKISTS